MVSKYGQCQKCGGDLATDEDGKKCRQCGNIEYSPPPYNDKAASSKSSEARLPGPPGSGTDPVAAAPGTEKRAHRRYRGPRPPDVRSFICVGCPGYFRDALGPNCRLQKCPHRLRGWNRIVPRPESSPGQFIFTITAGDLAILSEVELSEVKRAMGTLLVARWSNKAGGKP